MAEVHTTEETTERASEFSNRQQDQQTNGEDPGNMETGTSH